MGLFTGARVRNTILFGLHNFTKARVENICNRVFNVRVRNILGKP